MHTGNPGIEKSKKFISLNIAIIVGVKTDLVGAWLNMEGSIIKNLKISLKKMKKGEPVLVSPKTGRFQKFWIEKLKNLFCQK